MILVLLQEIIGNEDFFHHYQPIYDIQEERILGHEGLFRTENQLSPEIAFITAKKKKKLYELELRSIHKAFTTYMDAGNNTKFRKLFLNVFPSTLTNPKFQTFIQQIISRNNISSQQIILEINEAEGVNYDYLIQPITFLKNLGIGIAIDDFGVGYSSPQSIIEINPDYIKLDKYFINGINKSEQIRDFIKYLNQFCQKFEINLIAEGVEESISLTILKGMGVKYAQGYLLGKPKLLEM